MHALALVALAAAAAAAPERDRRLEAGPEDGRVRIHVAKKGLFSAFAHDHDFEVTRWRAEAELPGGDAGRATVEVSLQADSLRDRHEGLSDGDRRKVDAQAAGPEVLDAASHPEIVWRGARVALAPVVGAAPESIHGKAIGSLTLRGRTRPVEVALDGDPDGEGWRVRGRATFRQSDFGIRPFSGFGGAVGVKDEVALTFELTLRPAAARAEAAP